MTDVDPASESADHKNTLGHEYPIKSGQAGYLVSLIVVYMFTKYCAT